MFSVVEQDIDERVANLPWRLQLVPMMTIAEELPVTPRDGVHRKGDAREKRAHLIREVLAARALHQEMEMILLNRVMQHVNTVAFRA